MKQILAISILVAAASLLLAKEESVSLPPPISDKIYTFQQIEKQKAQLKDKVVRIEIASLVAGPGDIPGEPHDETITRLSSALINFCVPQIRNFGVGRSSSPCVAGFAEQGWTFASLRLWPPPH